jgi:hypothetical protein
MKIRPVETELFHADGKTEEQTDRHEVFRNFTKALINMFRPTVLCGSHSWANLLVLILVERQLLLKRTALASTYESQNFCEAAGRICEACCVGLLMLELLNE